jgi:uncharacterized membrane protein
MTQRGGAGASMSTNAILVIVGAMIFVFGLIRLRGQQTGGFNLSNIGLNIGSRNTQINKVGDIASGADKGTKPDWIGLVIAALGLMTALVGWLKG